MNASQNRKPERDETQIRKHNEKMREAISEAMGTLWRVASQLEAFGFLLERQGAEHEGPIELQGLGLALTDLSQKLDQMTRSLDRATLHRR